MSSPVGSVVFVLCAALLICISVLLLLRHYLQLRTTPAYLLVPVFLALALPFSLVILVPIDLASGLRQDEPSPSAGIWLPKSAVLVAWRVAYWLTFALTWFILPLLGEYVDSGYRTPRDRIIYSLKSNLQFYAIALACGLLSLVYILWQNGFNGSSVKALVMALAYCVGLIQAVLLLGHGLVAIPRHFFRGTGTRLRRMQTKAPKIREKLEDATVEMQDLNRQLEQLRQRKTGLSKDMEDWIEELDESGDFKFIGTSHLTTTLPSIEQRSAVPAVITERYLADLGRRITRSRHKVIRFTQTWSRLVQEAADMQAIIDSVATKKLEFQPDSTQPRLLRLPLVTPHARHILYHRVLPVMRNFLGVCLTVASLSIVWSELIKFKLPKISMISITVIRNTDTGPKMGFGGQILSVFWILYMCICTLSSLEDIKIWGNRALVRRNTYGESACWYSCQVAKLTVPLTYNFLTFTSREVQEATTFHKFLGNLIVLTPLGRGFDYFFPMLILIPACATLFNVYGRVKKLFGFGIMEDDEESPSFGTGSWREGRDLLERELQGRSQLESTPLSNQSSYTDRPDDQASEAQPPRPRGPATPTLYIPPAEDSSGARERQAQRLSAATQAAAEEDEDVFSGFAHRIRNTIDSIERPDWLSEVGKRPKWLGGPREDRPTEGGGSRPGDSSRRDSNGLGRWLGGRTASGRIRL